MMEEFDRRFGSINDEHGLKLYMIPFDDSVWMYDQHRYRTTHARYETMI